MTPKKRFVSVCTQDRSSQNLTTIARARLGNRGTVTEYCVEVWLKFKGPSDDVAFAWPPSREARVATERLV